MDKKTKLHLIFNPNSGKGKKQGVLDDIKSMLKDSFEIDVTISKSREQARLTAQKITNNETNPVILVAGGDGTVNDVINGCNLQNVTLGILPTGTINIVTRELNIPQDIKQACQLLKTANTKPLDIPTANSIRFMFGAGIGFDAQVIESINLKHKLLLGKAVYGIESFKQFFSFQPFEAKIKIDGKNVFSGNIFEIIVGKSKLYAGKYVLFPEASFDNEIIDVAVFAHTGRINFGAGFFKFFAHMKDKKRLYFRGKKIEIMTEKNVPYHVDGDVGDSTPVRFSIEKNPLNVFVPSERK